MQAKRILWLIHEGSLSGANICLLEWIIILKNAGYLQYLITPRLGEVTEELKKMGIPYAEIYYYSNAIIPGEKKKLDIIVRQQLRNLYAVKKVKSIAKSFKPDFIATNTITFDIGSLVATQLKIKHIWVVHEFGDMDHGFSFRKGLQNTRAKIINRSYKVAVISKAIAVDYEKINKEKVQLLYNSVNAEPCSPQKKIVKEDSGKIKLLMLGQVTPGKGQLDAIKAVHKCKQKGLEVRLDIYGSTENINYLKEIRNYIDVQKIKDIIFIHKQVKNVTELFADCTALLVCSKYEAFGRVTVEALKMGIPVIGANTGATLEIIDHQINGLLYEQENIVDLSNKIIQLKEDYLLFNKLEIAQKAKSKYNSVVSLSQLEKLFG